MLVAVTSTASRAVADQEKPGAPLAWSLPTMIVSQTVLPGGVIVTVLVTVVVSRIYVVSVDHVVATAPSRRVEALLV